jgi:hypothetical protein
VSAAGGGNVQLSFIGKLGIRYHPQSSSNLATWSDEGPAVFAPVLNPPGGGPVSVLLSTGSGIQKFFRLRVSY